MFSQTAEYALRAVVVLAEDSATPQTAHVIARKGRIPEDYLMKILLSLAKGGLVTAQRGRGGGFTLTRPPDQICVLDILSVVDPLRRITHCPLGIQGHDALCPLHRKLDDAIRLVEEAFATTTLGDLLADPSPIRPLCAREGSECHVPVSN
jgi:Rrf2 family protein